MDKESGCWNWTGPTNSTGYGWVHVGERRHFVHRLAFQLQTNRWLTRSQLVCHRCDNRKCFNPMHLFLGTHSSNLQDALQKGRLPLAKLNPERIREAKRLRALGIPFRTIADRLGVTHPTIINALNGRTWRHIYEQSADEAEN